MKYIAFDKISGINHNEIIFFSPFDKFLSGEKYSKCLTLLEENGLEGAPVILNYSNNNELTPKLFEYYCDKLKELHGLNLKNKTMACMYYPYYWEIINVIDVVVTGLRKIEKPEEYCLLIRDSEIIEIYSTLHANKELYHGSIYNQIVNAFGNYFGFKIKKIEERKVSYTYESASAKRITKYLIGKKIAKIISYVLKKLDSKKVLLGVTYLPLFHDLMFSLLMKATDRKDIKVEYRQEEKKRALEVNNICLCGKSIEELTVAILLKYTPLMLTENSKKLEENKYEIVYSANNYWYDEDFKMKTASAVQLNNAKVYIAEHGANITTVSLKYERPEFYIADEVLGWGDYKKNKLIGAFNFKRPNRIRNNKEKKGILVVFPVLDGRVGPLDYYSMIHEARLLSLLDLCKQMNGFDITIRLSSIDMAKFADEYAYLVKNDVLKYADIDFGRNAIKSTVCKYETVVFYYDSTGFRECISMGINTYMKIEEREYQQCDETIKLIYDMMISANLIHKENQTLLMAIKNKSVLEDHQKMMLTKYEKELCKTEKFPALKLKNIINELR